MGTVKQLRIQDATPACRGKEAIFLHPLIEDPSQARSLGQRREQQSLLRQAENTCMSCPLMQQCLYRAVVEHDVAGCVAGTTQRQRNEMRRQLRITVQPQDFDTMAGVLAPNRQVDHDEVVRLRTANPEASLESIAQRLGCSLSTVKRHLRRERNGEAATAPEPTTVRPTMAEVMKVYAAVMARSAKAGTVANRPAAVRKAA